MIEHRSASLRSAVQLMMASPLPMVVDLTVRTGIPYTAEHRVRRGEGDYHWALASGVLGG